MTASCLIATVTMGGSVAVVGVNCLLDLSVSCLSVGSSGYCLPDIAVDVTWHVQAVDIVYLVAAVDIVCLVQAVDVICLVPSVDVIWPEPAVNVISLEEPVHIICLYCSSSGCCLLSSTSGYHLPSGAVDAIWQVAAVDDGDASCLVAAVAMDNTAALVKDKCNLTSVKAVFLFAVDVICLVPTVDVVCTVSSVVVDFTCPAATMNAVDVGQWTAVVIDCQVVAVDDGLCQRSGRSCVDGWLNSSNLTHPIWPSPTLILIYNVN